MMTLGPLPFLKSLADAKAVCERERDPFYLDAFMIADGHTPSGNNHDAPA
jgi:hypothetical protein